MNSVLLHSQPRCFFFSAGLNTFTEKAGIHSRGLIRFTRTCTGRVAKALRGMITSSSSRRSTAADAMPETTMAASIAASTINSRLFAVFSAATPITSDTPR